MTKIPILIVALGLALVISACGSSDTGPAYDPTTTTTDAAAATTTTQVAASGGESFLDESFPTVEELQAAEDCDELNRMLAGVENENFRVNADRTLAEEEAEAEDEFENTFVPFY
ncbi:MAG: hypothetical protein O6951_09720 [Actinobacteria bacterium]|nr:hypothetical protein [Actinomycetota bacterium]